MALRAEFRGVLTGLALVAAVLLAMSQSGLGLAARPVLQSLQLHIGAGLLTLALLLAFARGFGRAVLVAGLGLLAVGHVAWRVYVQHEVRAPLAGAERVAQFTLLSFNVLTDNEHPEAAAREIIESGADIAVVLEAGGIGAYLDEMEAVYPYRTGCANAPHCGVLIFSRFPLSGIEVRSLGRIWAERLVSARVVIEGETVTVVAAHLTKPYFDYFGFAEVQALRRYLAQIEGPLVLAGDFNVAPWSDVLDGMIGNAGLIPPPRYHATWPVEAGPFGVPIDHVFSRAPAIVETIEVLPDAAGSNHYGLIARVGIAGE